MVKEKKWHEVTAQQWTRKRGYLTHRVTGSEAGAIPFNRLSEKMEESEEKIQKLTPTRCTECEPPTRKIVRRRAEKVHRQELATEEMRPSEPDATREQQTLTKAMEQPYQPRYFVPVKTH